MIIFKHVAYLLTHHSCKSALTEFEMTDADTPTYSLRKQCLIFHGTGKAFHAEPAVARMFWLETSKMSNALFTQSCNQTRSHDKSCAREERRELPRMNKVQRERPRTCQWFSEHPLRPPRSDRLAPGDPSGSSYPPSPIQQQSPFTFSPNSPLSSFSKWRDLISF